MTCKQCGASNRKKANFCKSCGEKLARTAPAADRTPESPMSRKRLLAGGAVVLLVLAGALAVFLSADVHQAISAENGAVRLAMADISDGRAHYYKMNAGGRSVKFFVLKAPDGQVRAALDACDVCYREKKGYRQDGTIMVCNNCENRFPADKINVLRGGCNPVPLSRRVDNGQLVLEAGEIVASARYF